MIRYFPSLFPDESIYSCFNRYDKHVGNHNSLSTIKTLLGKNHLRVTPLFTTNLEYMSSQFPEGTDFSADYFINNHTILPFYKLFVPTDRYSKAVDMLKNGSLTSVYAELGINGGSTIEAKRIKYCPECIEADRKLFKCAYLHRIHQVSGVYACAKHKCLLNEADFSTDSRDGLLDINKYVDSDSGLVILPRLTDEVLSLACDVNHLITNNDDFGDFDIVKKKITAQMYKKGYIATGGNTNQSKLHKDFLSFYTHEFLSLLQSDFDYDNVNNWLRILTGKKNIVTNPIRQILFIKFLFGDMNNFLQSSFEYLPFGEPPFPCLNSQSDHYRDLVIDTCQIKTSYHNPKAIGTFICSRCDYTYSLNIDVYQSTGFKRVRRKTKNSSIELGHDSPIFSSKLDEKYKNELSSLLLLDPSISRSTIQSLNKCAYSWLLSHDKEWFESRVVGPQSPSGSITRVNWEERDKETLAKVKQAVDEIRNEPTPIRITLNKIIKICKYAALKRYLHKMPLTSEFISSCTEALEHYHKRKIEAIIHKLIIEDGSLSRYVILRRAGIQENCHNYDGYIELKIKQYK
ncbi:MAG: TnsD family Tn7-like transposition protein [Desulfosporosinus sp.]|nr:TnsD family Tn7-like transposition protein [Desulfosporosinus sp.]